MIFFKIAVAAGRRALVPRMVEGQDQGVMEVSGLPEVVVPS